MDSVIFFKRGTYELNPRDFSGLSQRESMPYNNCESTISISSLIRLSIA